MPRVLRALQRRQPVSVPHRILSASMEQSGHHNVVTGIARSMERRGTRVRRREVWVGPRPEQQSRRPRLPQGARDEERRVAIGVQRVDLSRLAALQ